MLDFNIVTEDNCIISINLITAARGQWSGHIWCQYSVIKLSRIQSQGYAIYNIGKGVCVCVYTTSYKA